MSKGTRIGKIRELVARHGGRYDFTYFCDGPNSSYAPRSVNPECSEDVIYKVEKTTDGLSEENRRLVVEELNNDPEVRRAYISRNFTGYLGHSGNHIKVLFRGRAS